MKRCEFFLSRLAWLALAAWIGFFTPPAGAAEGETPVDPLDWPYWRGPEGNSISRETGLPDNLDLKPGPKSTLLWSKPEIAGRSTPIILRGKLYTLCNDNARTPIDREKVVCLDAATGEVKWENKFNVWSSDVPNTRVGWSSVVGDPATGNVYALGACGYFQCIHGETGKTLWAIPLHERLGLLSTYGGRTNFPVVVDDLVILGSVVIGWGDMAVPSHRFIGFDKATGEIRWFVSTRLRPKDTIYSAPTVAVIGGQKLLVAGSGDGWVYAFQPQTGKQIWEYQFSPRGLNLSPTVEGDTVYMGQSEENASDDPVVRIKMGAVVSLKGTLTGNITKTGENWKDIELGVGKSALLKVADRLYGADDAGKIYIVDAKDGSQIGKIGVGTTNHASPIFADGKIFHNEKSRLYILKLDEKTGLKAPTRRPDGTWVGLPLGDECWASPVVSHGRLYIQTTGALYCFEDQTKKHGATPRPPAPVETPASEDPKPAQLQLSPCEVLMRPGEKQKFTARVFNSRGQFLKEESAKLTLEGPGEISASGEFTSPKDAAHLATIVQASLGDLKARARIRSVPPLPWKFDFAGLKDAPITWVGARYRHIIRPVDGKNVMVKITTIPLGTRSRLSMGQSDLHDYTVQAQIKAASLDGKLPDFGVIAQGYTFAVEGLNKRLLLNSWGSHENRVAKEMPFQLKPDVWYEIKLRAENSASKAVVRGKIWPRGEKEPADWSIEIVDPQPNVAGSPGMFGNSTNGELFINQVNVTPNE